MSMSWPADIFENPSVLADVQETAVALATGFPGTRLLYIETVHRLSPAEKFHAQLLGILG